MKGRNEISVAYGNSVATGMSVLPCLHAEHAMMRKKYVHRVTIFARNEADNGSSHPAIHAFEKLRGYIGRAMPDTGY
jgi:hypothetical protein